VFWQTKKQQYHCDSCGICRGGGRDNFFHCDRCGCCYSNALQNGHPCVEKSMHQNCPVCFEVLFVFSLLWKLHLWWWFIQYFRTETAPLDVYRLSCLACSLVTFSYWFPKSDGNLLWEISRVTQMGIVTYVVCFCKSQVVCWLTHSFTLQYLFDSVKDITVLPCGHTMHLECLRDMHTHAQWVPLL
jgi:hypothetical protein